MSNYKNKISKKVEIDLAELLKKDAPYLVEDGKVDLEKLKGLLTGKTTEKEDDRFYFNWAGKDKVFQAIQAPAYSTLAPQKDKSIGWDETENLMIVGENLETLKLLLKPYFGKVKVIYIDPPYNTGKDFIYKDDFSSPLKDYLEKTGQKDQNGTGLTTNTETNGRYHSDWLSFMHPRLFMARNFLSENGVIFVSIDDHEANHLKIIMDDIYGEDNYLATFIVKSNPRGSQSFENVAVQHEYVLAYSKNSSDNTALSLGLTDKMKAEYKYTHKDGRKYRFLGLRQRGGAWRRQQRPSLYFPIYINENDGTVAIEKNDEYKIAVLPIKPTTKEDGSWRWSKDKVEDEKELLIAKQVDRDGAKAWDIFQIDFLTTNGKEKTTKPKTIWDEKELNYQNGTTELKNLFEGKEVFSFPKPTYLIEKILQVGNIKEKDIVLDFFAGSGTTGHALLNYCINNEVNGKFILIQLDESVDETKQEGKNAIALGLKNIAEICTQRLARVSNTLKEQDEIVATDLGFKRFNLKPSNFNLKEEFELTENKNLGELKINYLKELGLYVDQPTVATANTLDIVYEIILKNGFSLNSKIEELKLGSNNFYKVSDTENELEIHISLDAKIEDGSVEAIRTTDYKSKTFAFYDNALTDSQKINLNTFVKLQVI